MLITDKVNIWREIIEYGAGYAASDTVEGVTEVLRNWVNTTDATKQLMRERALACFNEKFHIEQVALSYLRIVGGQ